MGFRIFMILMAMLTPLIMTVFGAVFIKKPPEKINSFCGYRTRMAMKNTDTWAFAHKYTGRIWFPAGMVMTVSSLAVMIMAYGRDNDTVGAVSALLIVLQCTVMCITIALTERALRRNFDKNGKKLLNEEDK